MLASFALAATILAAAISPAAAWGADGHNVVGQIATAFLNPAAKAFVNATLSRSYTGDVPYSTFGAAATWADVVKYTSPYVWSKPQHYIDANDSPLANTCSVNTTRDCGPNGCILSALSNYTERITDASLTPQDRSEALKWILHYMGDLTQPLHVEGTAAGGNGVRITFGGVPGNLHSMWDTGMPKKIIADDFHGSNVEWADSLIARIQTGDFQSAPSSWTSCVNQGLTASISVLGVAVGSHAGRRGPNPDCLLEWASDSNHFDCSNVFVDQYLTADLAGEYFDQAKPIVDQQIAKGGYRLAAWLNALFPDYAVISVL